MPLLFDIGGEGFRCEIKIISNPNTRYQPIMSTVLGQVYQRHGSMAKPMNKESLILSLQEMERNAAIRHELGKIEGLGMEGCGHLVDDEGAKVLQDEDGLPANLGAKIFESHSTPIRQSKGLQTFIIVTK